jgi:hypothetical protein
LMPDEVVAEGLGNVLMRQMRPVMSPDMIKPGSKHAAFFGTLFGTACGMIGWMVGCRKIYGEITITV